MKEFNVRDLSLSRELTREIDRILSSDDPKQLLEDFKKCFQMTMEAVIKMAAYIRRLDELDVKIELDIAIIPYLKRVAYGQLAPALLVNLQGREKLLNAAATLPLPMQESIAQNKPVRISCIDGDHRMVPPLSMTNKEIAQVFANGRIRSDAEQVGFIRERIENASAKFAAETKETEILVDRRRGGLVVKGHFIPTSELARFLAELSRK